MKNRNIILILSSLYLSGCFNIYNDNYSCNKGLNTGVCSSVSQNYRASFEDRSSWSLTRRQKEALIENLENNKVVDDNLNLFGLVDDKVNDWNELSNLTYKELEYVKSYYEFSYETLKKIDSLIYAKKGYIQRQDPFYSNSKDKDLLYYQYLENERLRQKLKDTK